MRLLQRVVTLIKANLNDLVDRAEDPEKMIKQLICDLNNQLIQVKTTVAQSMADQYMMEKRLGQARKDAESAQVEAQLAVKNNDDKAARAALQRSNAGNRTAEEMQRQLEEQRKETEAMKLALGQLEIKISELTREKDVLLARHRRANSKTKLTKTRAEVHPERLEELLDAIGGHVERAEAQAKAYETLEAESTVRRPIRTSEDDALDKQLAALKGKSDSTTAAA
jgi:phage shock protein A